MARLNIPDVPSYAIFPSAAAQTIFPFSFPVFSKEDLNVTVNDVDLMQSGFTLSGSLADGGGYQGGTITLNAPATGKVVIFRNVITARAAQFAPANTTPVGSIDQALNRDMAILQDVRRDLGRTIKVPVGADALTLPPESARPGAFLGFDADGQLIAAQPSTISKAYLNIYVPALEDFLLGVGQGVAAIDQAALALAAASGKAVKADRDYLLSQRVTMAAGSMLVSDTGKGKITMRGASGAFDAATRAVAKEASNNLGFHLTGDKSGLMGLEIAFDTTGISAARTAAAITVDGAEHCFLHDMTFAGFRELAGGIVNVTRGSHGFKGTRFRYRDNVTSYNNTAIIPSIQLTGLCFDDESGGVYSESPYISDIRSDGGISQTDASSGAYGYQTDLLNNQSAAETFGTYLDLWARGIGEVVDFWGRGARIAGITGLDGKGVMLKLIYGAADLDITGVFGRRNALGDILISNAAGGSIPAPAKTVVRGIDIRGIDIRDSGKGFDYAYNLTRYPSAQSAQAAISLKSEGADGTLWPTDIRMEGTTVAYDGSGVGETSCPAPLVISNSGPNVSYRGQLIEAASTRKVLFLQNPIDTSKRPEVVLKNPPYVAASPSGAQTLASGAAIVFATESEDRTNAWDGTVFRPPVPGEYRLHGQVRVASVAAGVTLGVELQKMVYPSTWTKVKRRLQFQGSAGESYLPFDFREFMSPVSNPADSGSSPDQYRLVLFSSSGTLDITTAADLTWLYIEPVT